MTVRTNEPAAGSAASPTAAMVAAYLRENPDFFTAYPDVLRDIEITHSAGEAVSLLERQVAALREENERMKGRFERLVALAKSNEDLIGRIHQLALALMEAAGPEAIFATLSERLAGEFKADRVRALVFARTSFLEPAQVPQFVGRDSAARKPFTELLRVGVPRCGALTEAQTASLFDGGTRGGSAALLPLSGKGWDGLLAISSNDERRFDKNMGTEFLAYLGDIVSLIVDPWVARSQPG
jgi:uncharacterized protein